MIPKVIQVLDLAIRELVTSDRLARTPEPSAVMDDETNVRSFHAQGSENGPLLPVYHFNALAISALAPAGGRLLDLGSGSGQFLSYLATIRPDLRILGLDLSPGMIAVGQEALKSQRLDDRVSLREGDMTHFVGDIVDKVDVISSVFSLHHLPDESDLKRCLGQIGALSERDGSAVWIFDHNRPKSRRTAERFPEVFTPGAAPAFRRDSCNSLVAAYDFSTLAQMLDQEFGDGVEHAKARFLPLYQVHRRNAIEHGDGGVHGDRGSVPSLPRWAVKDFRGLCTLFPRVLSREACAGGKSR
jgi:SAM-dependent methyltransferase